MSNSPAQKSKRNQKSALLNSESAPKVNLIGVFKPYGKILTALLAVAILSNVLNLAVPRLIGFVIDQYQKDINHPMSLYLFAFLGLVLIIFLTALGQTVLSTYLSEKVAKDYRSKLIKKLSAQSYSYINEKDPSNLLTNLTSDVDNVKNLVSQSLIGSVSAIILLVGSVILLLSINLKLGLIGVSTLPVIIVVFFLVFRSLGSMFRAVQQNLGKINQVINESIVGATLIRVLNARQDETDKFEKYNQIAKGLGYKIVNSFATIIPIVNLLSNLAIVLIIWFGGHLVVDGELSLGQFSAFITYYNLLITPIFILGFLTNILSRSVISLERIEDILQAPVKETAANDENAEKIAKTITGNIEFRNVTLNYGNKRVLDNISFKIQPKTKNAIVGPTAAGKTQIFYLLTGLVKPDQGEILIDGENIQDYDQDNLFQQLGLVFQDSLIFNSSLKENIQFNNQVQQEDLDKSLKTAMLEDLVESLPQGLDTKISERGSNLSGGQKQRLMLARSLAVNPKILLLDDFTARVDMQTERRIIQRIDQEYKGVTLISITQKVQPITEYDQILLLMEGELLASGTHQELLESSLEYQQIWTSQQSTEE